MSSARRGKGKKKQPPSLGQRLKPILAWRPWQEWTLELGPVQRQILGLALLLLSLVTFLGLVGVSTGVVLGWWVDAVRQAFGWVSYAICLTVAVVGLRLLWEEMGARLPFGPEVWVALELLLLVLLVAAHSPLVIRVGADAAVLGAQQGRGGGYAGWAVAVLLMKGLGPIVGSLVLLVAFLIGLSLLFSVSWGDIHEWVEYRSRTLIALVSRWRTTQQGTLVVPETPDVPWWEQGPESSSDKPQKKKKPKATAPSKRKKRPVDGTLPPLDLLEAAATHEYGDADVQRRAKVIEETLDSFGVPSQVVEIRQGPTVTQFGLDPGYIERRVSGGDIQLQRVRVAQIARLSDDLALALAAAPIRIEAPVPGRSVVGLEVPNKDVSVVSLRGVMDSDKFECLGSPLALALGEDVSGLPIVVDLALMPHLLIAGATGSGKSVCMNAIICCLLSNNTPEDLQMIMIDPKMVELVGYNGIPHLVAPVIVGVEQVVAALAWVTSQMDERYRLFHEMKVRNLEEYNKRASRLKNRDPLPILAVFLDELADLMMVSPDEVERHICRVAQMGRATGIHLVIATQRPSTDVVTGLIKANFPARISFAVTSQVDSRVILDRGGAETLLGRGDMLFLSPRRAAPIRLQGCYVSDKEIQRLAGFWRDRAEPEGQSELFPPWTGFGRGDEVDDMLQQAIDLISGKDRVSTSFVQRKLHIGFPRAARLIDQLEDQGLVGPDEGGGRGRQVLVGRAVDLDEIAERLPGVEPD